METLTSEDLPLLSDVPGVQGGTLLRLHGGTLVEMLGEMGLVQARDVYHLPLRDVVLLHVALDHLGRSPRVLAGQRSTGLGCECTRLGAQCSCRLNTPLGQAATLG